MQQETVMNTSQILEAAVRRFRAAHRLDTDHPNTYPHVLEATIRAEIDERSGGVVVWHFVANGYTAEEQGSVYPISVLQ